MKRRNVILGVAFFAAFLMLISPSISANILYQKESSTLKLDEDNNEQKSTKSIRFFFCNLRVYTYYQGPPNVGRLTYGGVRVRLEDLDTGIVRDGTTGFFGLKLFFGLQRGHTYKVTALDYDVEKEITLSYFGLLNRADLCVVDPYK